MSGAAPDIAQWISQIFQAGFTKVVTPTLTPGQTYVMSSMVEYIPCTWPSTGTITVKGNPIPVVGSWFVVHTDSGASGSTGANKVHIDMGVYTIEDPFNKGTFTGTLDLTQGNTSFGWNWDPNLSHYTSLFA